MSAVRAARDLLGDPAAGRAWLLEPDGSPEGYVAHDRGRMTRWLRT